MKYFKKKKKNPLYCEYMKYFQKQLCTIFRLHEALPKKLSIIFGLHGRLRKTRYPLYSVYMKYFQINCPLYSYYMKYFQKNYPLYSDYMKYFQKTFFRGVTIVIKTRYFNFIVRFYFSVGNEII